MTTKRATGTATLLCLLIAASTLTATAHAQSVPLVYDVEHTGAKFRKPVLPEFGTFDQSTDTTRHTRTPRLQLDCGFRARFDRLPKPHRSARKT